MGTTARRCAVAVVVAFAAAVIAGCASDETVTSTATTTPVTASSGTSETTEAPPGTDPGDGEYAEACALIDEIDQTAEDDLASALVLFEEARDAGPEELVDHWDTLTDTLTQIEALGATDADLTRALELMADPAFMEAAATIDDFATDECGLDVNLDPSDEDTTGGLTDPGSTDTTSTTDPDDDPTSIDALQAHLKSEYGTEAWWPVLDDATSWGASTVGGDVEWSVTISNADAVALTASDLEAACGAMAEYLDTYEDGAVSIEIIDADDAVLVSRAPGAACAAA